MTDSLSSSPVVGWAEQAKARCEAATEGPWEAKSRDFLSDVGWYLGGYIPGVCGVHIDGVGESAPLSEDDAIFIAHARTDLPRALEALEVAVKENAKMREAILRWYNGDNYESSIDLNDIAGSLCAALEVSE